MSFVEITSEDGGKFKAYLATPPDCKKGPGLVLIQEIFGINANMRQAADTYAADGYTVLVPDLFWRIQPNTNLSYEEFEAAIAIARKLDTDLAIKDVVSTGKTLNSLPTFEGRWGVMGFCMGGRLAFLTAARYSNEIACAVSYYGTQLSSYLAEEGAKVRCPIYFHFGEKDDHTPSSVVNEVARMFDGKGGSRVFVYEGAGHAFAAALRPQNFNPGAYNVARERTMQLLQRTLGHYVDLDTAWQNHLTAELKTGDAATTVATMSDNPQVLLLPSFIRGSGTEGVFEFYKKHFIPDIPKDFLIKPLSRTIGSSQVVDEFIAEFTHDIKMEWLLPGVPPTGRQVKIPMVVIVGFSGDKIKSERVYWDQASVLVQVGLLEKKGLPVFGVEVVNEV